MSDGNEVTANPLTIITIYRAELEEAHHRDIVWQAAHVEDQALLMRQAETIERLEAELAALRAGEPVVQDGPDVE